MTDIRDLRFPLWQPSSAWRRELKCALGAALCRLRPDRERQLVEGLIPSPMRLADRVMVAALVARHEKAGTLAEMTALHRAFWTGPDAVRFHKLAESRFQNWWLEHHAALVGPIEAELKARLGHFTTLCEIGCGSGLVLQDLASRLPQLRDLIGLDLSPEQTQLNCTRFVADSRLSFVSSDATKWIPEHARGGTIFITCAGVLEYIREETLSSLFAQIAEQLRPALFFHWPSLWARITTWSRKRDPVLTGPKRRSATLTLTFCDRRAGTLGSRPNKLLADGGICWRLR